MHYLETNNVYATYQKGTVNTLYCIECIMRRIFVIIFICFLFTTAFGCARKPIDPNDPKVAKERLLIKIKEDETIMKSRIAEKQVKTHAIPMTIAGAPTSITITNWGEYKGTNTCDILATNQAATPFAGIVNYDVTWHHIVSDINKDRPMNIKIRATYTYQDGNWVLKEATWIGTDGNPSRSENTIKWATGLFTTQ